MVDKKEKKSLNKFGKSPINAFFNLGNKVTKGDPIRKALFDYSLYWIVFLAFIFVAISYYRTFFLTLKFNSLMWALILTAVSWFNYWGLSGFKMAYDNQKNLKESLSKLNKKDTPSQENTNSNFNNSVDEMLKEFGDDNKELKGGKEMQ